MDNRKNPSHLLSYSVILIIRLLVYRRIQKLYNINKLFEMKPLDLNNIQKYLTKVLYGTEWIIESLTPKYRGRDRIGNWIYKYLCNQCLTPLILGVRISTRARSTSSCDKVCQWLATGWWFSPDHLVSSANKTDRNDIAEILLKMVLSTINQTKIKKQI